MESEISIFSPVCAPGISERKHIISTSQIKVSLHHYSMINCRSTTKLRVIFHIENSVSVSCEVFVVSPHCYSYHSILQRRNMGINSLISVPNFSWNMTFHSWSVQTWATPCIWAVLRCVGIVYLWVRSPSCILDIVHCCRRPSSLASISCIDAINHLLFWNVSRTSIEFYRLISFHRTGSCKCPARSTTTLASHCTIRFPANCVIGSRLRSRLRSRIRSRIRIRCRLWVWFRCWILLLFSSSLLHLSKLFLFLIRNSSKQVTQFFRKPVSKIIYSVENWVLICSVCITLFNSLKCFFECSESIFVFFSVSIRSLPLWHKFSEFFPGVVVWMISSLQSYGIN